MYLYMYKKYKYMPKVLIFKAFLTKEEKFNNKCCSSLGYKNQEPKSGLQKHQINRIYT